MLYSLFPRKDPGVKSKICPTYPQRVVKGVVSESPYKKSGPVSVLGRLLTNIQNITI